MAMDYQLSTKVSDRIFFIVDRSRMVKETDELKDAIVVYHPESDLKKVRILPHVSRAKQALSHSRYACMPKIPVFLLWGAGVMKVGVARRG